MYVTLKKKGGRSVDSREKNVLYSSKNEKKRGLANRKKEKGGVGSLNVGIRGEASKRLSKSTREYSMESSEGINRLPGSIRRATRGLNISSSRVLPLPLPLKFNSKDGL